MELRVQILTGLEVTSQIRNNTVKSLMIAKAVYELRAPFLDRCFF